MTFDPSTDSMVFKPVAEVDNLEGEKLFEAILLEVSSTIEGAGVYVVEGFNSTVYRLKFDFATQFLSPGSGSAGFTVFYDESTDSGFDVKLTKDANGVMEFCSLTMCAPLGNYNENDFLDLNVDVLVDTILQDLRLRGFSRGRRFTFCARIRAIAALLERTNREA